MFALPISMPRFKSIIFFIKTVLKLSYFCKKTQNFRTLGATTLHLQNSLQVDDPSLFAELVEFFGCKARCIVSNNGMWGPEMEKFLLQ